MVARIAPSPITTSVASSDSLAHATDAAFAPSAQSRQQPRNPERIIAQVNAPAPPAPPGEAFAAAVIAGQLPPVPVTPEQLRQRLGAAWQPPASPLRLMDRSA